VIFGAVHQPMRSPAAVFASGAWRTPLGDIPIDEELAAAVIQSSPEMVADPNPHGAEHSIEVQVPFVQHLAPKAKLLPIMVLPGPSALDLGRDVAKQATALGRRVAFLGSTDLTHYGPRYRMTPMGVGPDGLKWAKEVNDRRMIDLVVGLQAEKVVAEAAERRSACGSGAIAAVMGASQATGATWARLLQHTTSSEVLSGLYGDMADAVGYAGIVFGEY